MRDGFAGYNPIVVFIYYMVVLGTTMFIMNPATISVALTGAAVYYLYIKKMEGIRLVSGLIPLLVIVALINGLFNHRGATLLFYLPGDNPFTVEAMIYGLFAGMMLAAVILWFGSFNQVFTPEKLLYVIGRRFPSLGMVICLVFTLVPGYRRQAGKISEARKALLGNEKYDSTNLGTGRLNKIKIALSDFDSLTGWALENSITRADSMRARGYGSGKRSHYSAFRFKRRDLLLLLAIFVSTTVFLERIATGGFKSSYYPWVEFRVDSLGMMAYIILCLIPVIISIQEDLIWLRLKSKI